MAEQKKGLGRLRTLLGQYEKTLTINIDQFLRTNTRVDRDKVIMKREQVKTLKLK